MALNYIYKKSKDIYTIENIATTPLNYIINKQDCDNVTLYKEGVIEAGKTFTLPIYYSVGEYQVILFDNTERITLPIIYQYKILITSIVNHIDELLCGCQDCKCQDCDGKDPCKLELDALVLTITNTFIYNPKYAEYLKIISNHLKCLINDETVCYLTSKEMTGKGKTKSLYLNILGLYYLVFYFIESYEVPVEEEEMLTGSKPQATHYIHDENEYTDLQANKLEKRNKLVKEVAGLTLKRKRDIVLIILNETTENKNENYLTVKLETIMNDKTYAKELEELLEDSKETLSLKADIKSALVKNVLKRTKSGIFFFENNLGFSEKDVIDFLIKPENQEILLNIKSKIQ